MLQDDIIYSALLLLSVAFGHYYRKIGTAVEKQWISTAFGLLIVTVVSGGHVIHPIISTLINGVIVTRLSPKLQKYCFGARGKGNIRIARVLDLRSWDLLFFVHRICHLVSLYFTFFYLLVIFRLAEWLGMPEPPSHTNLIQMIMTLKLAGIAFEVNAAATAPPDDPHGDNSEAMKNITVMDVFHYAFSYMGILTGPYYRYRTYWDSLHRPYANYVDSWPITSRKLKQVICFVVIFFVTNHYFPAKYALTEEFARRSFFYRYFFIYPTFVTFRMRMFAGMILSECVCQVAGVGVYPTSCDVAPGRGPRNYKSAERLTKDLDQLKKEPMNYEAICNMYIPEVETCISVRTAMKRWNTCTQYWMANCVYRRFPHKGLRTMATLIVSALWHGYAPGYYTTFAQIPLFLLMEDIYVRVHEQCGDNTLSKRGLTIFLWYMKMSCMAYLGIGFQLLHSTEAIDYYKSVYFVGQITVAVLYVVGIMAKPYVLKREKKVKDN